MGLGGLFECGSQPGDSDPSSRNAFPAPRVIAVTTRPLCNPADTLPIITERIETMLTPEFFMLVLGVLAAVFVAESIAFGISALIVDEWRDELGLIWVFSLLFFTGGMSVLVLAALISSIGGSSLVAIVGIVTIAIAAFTFIARKYRQRYVQQQARVTTVAPPSNVFVH
jgi:uncharacterized membrane protein